tara:strand:- start:1075 stop:1578 length:504 start_codon:yes stop_codon:yes gene_type:complete
MKYLIIFLFTLYSGQINSQYFEYNCDKYPELQSKTNKGSYVILEVEGSQHKLSIQLQNYFSENYLKYESLDNYDVNTFVVRSGRHDTFTPLNHTASAETYRISYKIKFEVKNNKIKITPTLYNVEVHHKKRTNICSPININAQTHIVHHFNYITKECKEYINNLNNW